MSLLPQSLDGYYDDKGNWQRTKFCFVDCGGRCTCKPPLGVWTIERAESLLSTASEGKAG